MFARISEPSSLSSWLRVFLPPPSPLLPQPTAIWNLPILISPAVGSTVGVQVGSDAAEVVLVMEEGRRREGKGEGHSLVHPGWSLVLSLPLDLLLSPASCWALGP